MSPIRPILILVVDDEPYLADLAKSFLTESEGLEVETAYSVSDARTILAKRHFDAIISDYQMPREDGLQFLKSLRQSGDNIPFVLFTGRGREEVVIEALNNGADSYLQKGGLPVPAYTELEHRVRKAVQRHRAEMALVKSAVDLREAQEIAHMGRWERDLVSGQIEWSDGLFTIFEVDPDTFPPAHDSSLNFTHPEDRAIVEKAYGESAEKRKPYDFEHRLLLRDGSIKWVSEIGRTLYDDAGGPIRSVGTIQDITERKQNEAALKDASYAQRLIGASLDPLLAIDAEGVITEANAATSKLTGVSHEELIGADLSRYFTDPLKAKEGYLKVFKEGEVRDYPATLLGPSGRRVDVTYSASVYRDEYGRIKGVLVAIHDVTERKVAQDALKETEARFDQLAEQSGTVTWEADQEGLFTYVSSVSEIAWGYHPDELMGQMHFYDLVVEAERETIKSRVFEMAKHGERFVGIEHAVRTKDGRTRWNSTSGIPLLKADGSIRGYQGSDTDVSERKVVEEELLKISQRLSLATRAGGVGIWDLDVINNKLIWDDQMFKLYGIEEAHFGGAYEAWKAGLFPEDAQRGDEEIQMALRDEKEFDTEFRVLWPNRTVHHIRALAVVQRDASGKPLRMMGTNWDITDLRRAEKINLDKERSLRNEAEEQLTRYPKPSPELMEQKKMILIHELQVHQVELEMQAQELRKAQNAVEESRDKYLDLYEFAPLGYLTLTDKAQVEGANITSAALLGIDRGKLVGARFSKFLAEEEADKWHLYFRNVLRHREKPVSYTHLTLPTKRIV